MVRIYNSQMDKVISFSREKNGHKVVTLINFSNTPSSATFQMEGKQGPYKDLFTGNTIQVGGNIRLSLPAYGFMVLER